MGPATLLDNKRPPNNIEKKETKLEIIKILFIIIFCSSTKRKKT